jgi:hypothetical protein
MSADSAQKKGENAGQGANAVPHIFSFTLVRKPKFVEAASSRDQN